MAAESIQIPGYEILRTVGSGGMSKVYLAVQRSLDRKVAIKVMRRSSDAASDAGQIEKRFLLEGRMLAKLPHRNIVAVYDIVSNQDIAYITMEYLGGGVLSDRMRSGLSLADAVSVIVQIASALEFAHERGVVHRDLKPANIMFRDTGAPVLTDFGIARYQDGSAARLTQTGMLVGTPTYMSPEQINGVAVDGRADQYSLGILFHELLTGAPPFRADTSIAVLMAHLSQPLPPLPIEFRAFDDVIQRMLAKNRDERYPNLKVFSEDLKSRLVNSDTLLMRLQVDPNQPSSEQLRALGFSTSTPSAAGVRDFPSRTSTPRVVAAPPKAAPAVSPGESVLARAKKRPVQALSAIGLIVLMLAIGAWAIFGHRSSLNSDERELVALWLDRAERRVESNQLLSAKELGDSSAFEYLQRVLQKDPGNAQAQALVDRIAIQLVALDDAALKGGSLDKALEFANQGLQVHPGDASLLALKTRIEQAQTARPAPVQTSQTPPPQPPSVPQTATPTTSAATSSVPSASAAITAAPDTVAPASTNAAATPASQQPSAAPRERDELILNAQPWATVESVLDEQQQPITLPADATTPFTLSVPPGKYVVTFHHPQIAKSVQVTATVEANKHNLAAAVFPTTSAQGYFSRAGW